MTDDLHSAQPADPLNELVTHLLACGGALSQVIAHMVKFQASGRAAPDSAPIPEVAHTLILGVLSGVQNRHSNRDVKVAAAIVREATEAIVEEIMFVGPELN
jgi:hypothetical protein